MSFEETKRSINPYNLSWHKNAKYIEPKSVSQVMVSAESDIVLPSNFKEMKFERTQSKFGVVDRHVYEDNKYVTILSKIISEHSVSERGGHFSLFDYFKLSLKYSKSDFDCDLGYDGLASIIYASRILLGGGESDFKVFSSNKAIVITRSPSANEYGYVVILPTKDKSKIKYVKYLSNDRGFMEAMVFHYMQENQ